MSPENKNSRVKVGIPEERQGKVRGWSEMSYLLDPFGLERPELKLARFYFNAEKFIAEGKYVRGKRRFNSLKKNLKQEFERFEDEHPLVLKAIDIAVKGSSKQDTD